MNQQQQEGVGMDEAEREALMEGAREGKRETEREREKEIESDRGIMDKTETAASSHGAEPAMVNEAIRGMDQQQQNGVGMDETGRVASSHGMELAVIDEAREVAMEGKGMEAVLFNAAREGNVEIIIEKMTPGEVQTTPTGKTILHIASEFDRYKCVEEILELDPDLLFRVDRHGDTALHVAARMRHFKAAKALIKAAKCLRSRDPDIESGNLTTVGEFITKTNNMHNTALHEAVDVQYSILSAKIIVELLVGKCSEYNYLPNKRNETPLYIAAERGHPNLALAILQGSRSVRHDGPLGRTTLHAAVMSDLKGLTKELLERRPDLAKQADDDCWTPLHWAAYFDHSHRVRQLLEHDPTLAYIMDKDGWTSLHVASRNNSVSSMKIITSICPDCYDMVDHKGRNALHYAVMHRQRGSTSFLLRGSLFRSLLNEGDEEGNTALHLCPPDRKVRLDFNIYSRFWKTDWRSLNNNDETAGSHRYGAPRMGRINTSSSSRRRFLITNHRRFRVPKDSMEVEKEVESNKERGDTGPSYMGNQLVVAALIATVSFAAGFTLPGGYNDAGKAILSSKPMFRAFLIADALAFVFSMMAVYFQFYVPLTAPKRWPLKYVERSGAPFTQAALLSMLIAFITGVSAAMESSGFTTALQIIIIGSVLMIYLCLVGYVRGNIELFGEL